VSANLYLMQSEYGLYTFISPLVKLVIKEPKSSESKLWMLGS